jgi:hypothetical protein
VEDGDEGWRAEKEWRGAKAGKIQGTTLMGEKK